MTQNNKKITELMSLANGIKPLIEALDSEMQTITTRMADLEVLGLSKSVEKFPVKSVEKFPVKL